VEAYNRLYLEDSGHRLPESGNGRFSIQCSYQACATC
jgi:hypothetical protein